MNIIKYPDPILETACEEVPPFDDETRQKAAEMVEVMHGFGGLGLAAPQVGWPVRLFVADLKDADAVFVDPFIVRKSGGRVTKTEGCLSIPGVGASIPRYKKIEISYLDLDGNELTLRTDDTDIARVIQHEQDHLDGILFVRKAIQSDRKRVLAMLAQLNDRKEMEDDTSS